MPTLKQITCHVEWSDSDLPLHEYQTIYADGFVETYVAVPPVSTAFSIHLRSRGYIAPGLAMFVYMDGEYQCNRNRSNLKIPSEAKKPNQTEVDFKVRQKEELMPDGFFRGKQWKFESLRTEPSNHNDPAKRFAPDDAQYFGTIEVVVLRCYPTQPPKNLSSSRFIAESIPVAYPQESSSPLSTDVDNSSSSSNDESTSGESPASAMADIFDGPADYVRRSSTSFPFGGDMALDQQPSDCEKVQPQLSPYTRQNLGNADTSQFGSFSGETVRHDQLDGPSDAQNWYNQAVPNNWENKVVTDSNWQNKVVSDSNWQNHDNTQNQNPSSGSVRHSNHGYSASHSGSQNRVSRSSTGTKRTPGGNGSNDQFSTSNRSNKSLTGNAANQNSANSVWIHPQQPSAQGAPAVVINVSHGTPQPATRTSPASNQVINSGSAKTQRDKIDEYLAGTNQSPEGSNQSKTSTRSIDSQVWPTQNYDQTNDNSNQINNASQWHDQPSHGAVKEDQWPTIENAGDSSGQPGVSNNPNSNFPWDNKDVSSQPSRLSNFAAQNNNVSYHAVRSAGAENKQAQYGNPPLSVHPSQEGQVPQQPSSLSNVKASLANNTSKNDAPNSQYPGIRNNEAAQHISPQPWTQVGGKPNNQASGLPPQAASHMYGSNLPVLIDPRPRPHWHIWKQPQAASSNFPKDEVPRIEPAEPLSFVPWEVAQMNRMSHQVYLSQPAEYVHKRASPRYLDNFSCPYAVFIFKYRSKAILEQILNTTLIEPEAQEKERLQDLSKEELIEQILKAKMYKDNNPSETASSHTVKPDKPVYVTSNAAADDGRFASQRPSQPPNGGIVPASDHASTNPELHWGRRSPILNTMPPHPEAKVANWLGSASGGGHGHGGGSANGSGGGNPNYGAASKNGSVRNSNQGLGVGNHGTQHSVMGEWNKFGTAGAWGTNNDGQHTTLQTAGNVHGSPGLGHQGSPHGAPVEWNKFGTAGAWGVNNDDQHPTLQTAGNIHGSSGSVHQGSPHGMPVEWNKFGTAGAWGVNNDNQYPTLQTAGNVHGSSGSAHEGSPHSTPVEWNEFGTAGAWFTNNDEQQTVQQTTTENAPADNGDGEGQPGVEW